jgi:hypothetical protein
VQYIADAPRYSDYFPTVQKMIAHTLVIKRSIGTGNGPIPDNVTKLYPDNVEKCYNGLCYIQWCRHLTADLTVQKRCDQPLACRLTNPGAWFHYNNTWEGKGMMEACTCNLRGVWSCVT